MTFLNPLLLFGLVAAAIPLIIHLFNFRRPRRVAFSSLAFLREVQRSTMQRVRIKQWLLLLLRMLVLVMLVLAFARPVLRGRLASAIGGRATSSIGVVVDNSPSMELRDARGAFIEQARQAAKAIVRSGEARDEAVVIPVVAGTTIASAPGPAGEGAVPQIDEIGLRPGTTSLASAWSRAEEQIETSGAVNHEVYLLSDLQASTLIDSISAPTGDATVFLVPIGSGEVANLGVTDVAIRTRIVEVAQPVSIEAVLTNHGDTPVDRYAASVYIGGSRVAQASADLSPRASETVAFAVSPSSRGWLAGYVEIEDDDFMSDNRRYFTLHVPNERRVLRVEGDGANARYLDAALSDRITQTRGRFAVTKVHESLLSSSDLSRFDVVVLVGVASLSSGEINLIANFVSTGGGLLVFPGPRGSKTDYDALLQAVGGGRFADLPPAPPSSQPIDAFDRVDMEHPLFDGMLESGDGARPLESPDIYRRITYTPGRGTESTLIRLASGVPFLQEIRHGRGVVLLAGVAPDPTWSDLPTRGLFIPLLYRSIFLLSSTDAVSGERFVAGGSGDLLLPGRHERARIELVLPDGESVVPTPRRIVGGLLLTLDGHIERPGTYDVMADGEVVRRFAVNGDPRESDLRREDATQAARLLTAWSGRDVQVLELAADRAEVDLGTARRGVELWNVFLLLALLALVGEMLVARLWQPEAA